MGEITQPFREFIKPNNAFLWTVKLDQFSNDTDMVVISKVEQGIETF